MQLAPLRQYWYMIGIVSMICNAFFCTRHLTPHDYLSYYEKNRERYSYNVNNNGVSATISYLPSEIYAARQMLAYNSTDPEPVLQRFCKSLYLVCSIGSDDPDNPSFLLLRDGLLHHKRNVLKHTYGHNDNVLLVSKEDTIKCTGYQFERGWGISHEDSFIMTFDKQKLKKDINTYHLYMRDIALELGTIDVPIKKIVKTSPKLKG